MEDSDRKKEKPSLATQLTGVAVITVLALSVVRIVNVGLDVAEIHSQVEEIRKATREIEIPSYKAPIEGQAEKDTEFLFSVAQQGDEVARAQDGFLHVFSNTEIGSDEYVNGLEEAKQLMRPHFEEGAGSWYMAGDNAVSKDLHWEFVGGYDMLDEVPCVWLLKDGNGKLVAYTVAEYAEESGKFFGPQCVMTDYGRTLSSEADEPDHMEKYNTEPGQETPESEEDGGDLDG